MMEGNRWLPPILSARPRHKSNRDRCSPQPVGRSASIKVKTGLWLVQAALHFFTPGVKSEERREHVP